MKTRVELLYSLISFYQWFYFRLYDIVLYNNLKYYTIGSILNKPHNKSILDSNKSKMKNPEYNVIVCN